MTSITPSKARKLPAAKPATKASPAKTASMTPAPAAAAPSPPPSPAPAAPTGKLAILVTLLSRPQGATIADMAAATSWQAHSIRGAIAGAIKKKLGKAVSSEKSDGGRVYRIAPDAA